MITDIGTFIDLGWYTVPLQGELRRLSNGKKTLPMFPERWNTVYAETRNTKVTALGGVLTGKISDIIAIDCDDPVTFKLFKTLDPTYKFQFISKGKKDALGNDIEAGIIVYKYVDELAESFRNSNSGLKLDFYSTGGFIYLPTQANSTKEPFTLVALKYPPEEVVNLLKALKPIKITPTERQLLDKKWVNYLSPQIERFIRTKKIVPALFKMLTPKDFRELPEYHAQGYIKPDDVPEGRGSEYLSKVSAILGADPSIDPDLYVKAIETLNNFFSQPMQKARLNATIIEPMVEGQATIDGVPIWQYDDTWHEKKLQIFTKRDELLDAFYDPNRMNYYIADTINEKFASFGDAGIFQNHLETIGIDVPPKKVMKQVIPLANAVSTPKMPFGFYKGGDEDTFNTFSPTQPLIVFKNPEIHKELYVRPIVTLQFLESLIPNIYMRNYLLKFLRRKFDTFEYSPVVLYFLGVPGAGKDTLVSIIEKIIGTVGVSRPSVKQFLEIYNGWLLDTYFVQLDEFGNQLTRHEDKELATGYIKAYTGKSSVRIRTMRTDGYEHHHSITFIMTANKNPLFVEGDDRRIALFDTPNKLADEVWVQTYGGISAVHTALENELCDFAYYLATEVDNLSRDEYMEPPNTEEKKQLIASKFGAGQKLAFLLAHGMFVDIEKLARTYDVADIFKGAAEGRIYEDDLYDLYYEMTDGQGQKRGLSVCMREFNKVPTTSGGVKAYYYEIPGLKQYKKSRPFTQLSED